MVGSEMESTKSSLNMRLYNTVVVSIEGAVTWWIPPAPDKCALTEQCTLFFSPPLFGFRRPLEEGPLGFFKNANGAK
jgi:hypothetical protein